MNIKELILDFSVVVTLAGLSLMIAFAIGLVGQTANAEFMFRYFTFGTGIFLIGLSVYQMLKSSTEAKASTVLHSK